MWTPRNSGHLLQYSPFNVNEGVLGPPFPVVHDQLLCLGDVEGEVVVLAPHCQVFDLLSTDTGRQIYLSAGQLPKTQGQIYTGVAYQYNLECS